jgi:thymidine kinase
MFAGKTAKLISLAKTFLSKGKDFVVIKHAIDDRYESSTTVERNRSIISHDGQSYPALTCSALSKLDPQVYENAEYILVDEGQFFSDLLTWVETMKKDAPEKNLIIAGLNLTYQKKPFGQMVDLINIADVKIPLTAQCDLCYGPAHFTHRKVPAGDQVIVVGGADKYQPLCETCFDALSNGSLDTKN